MARARWIEGVVQSPIGEVPRVGTALRFADRMGTLRTRCGVGRTSYSIPPGLYAVGAPTPESPVLVSANYKMSFDQLRSRLDRLDAWILVLDTRGVNVWCAAGKGTFGTEELVKRAAAVRLGQVVTHKRLVVPQLGATGVSAHEVEKRSGFRVVFGPVHVRDLTAFLAAGMKATPGMRRVAFPVSDRVVLIPVEFVNWAGIALIVASILVLLSGLGADGYSLVQVRAIGLSSAALLFAALIAGAIFVPVLLPWLPGRSFAAKGAWVGLLCDLAAVWYAAGHPELFANWAVAGAWLLFIPAVTSFVGMNFTGASTYTSLSGVLKEMRTAVPLQIGIAVCASGLWIAGLFV